MKLEILEDVYKQKLAELYDTEQQLLRFLPKIAHSLPNPEWQNLLERHIEETKTHCRRLEELMTRRGVAQARKSRAMSGIIADAKELLKQESSDPQILGLALASAAQDVEGHEITCYASAHTFARLLGYHEDLKPLEQTFQEEKNMEDALATFAEAWGLEEMENETEVQPAQSGHS